MKLDVFLSAGIWNLLIRNLPKSFVDAHASHLILCLRGCPKIWFI